MVVASSVPCPEGDNSRFVRFARIFPGTPQLIWLLGNHVMGFTTHYFNGRTFPCTTPARGCLCCQTPLTSRWLGVIACQPHLSRAPFLLGLTRGAYAACPELSQWQHALRGVQLAVKRDGPSKNSPLSVRVTSAVPETGSPILASLQPTVDVCYHLGRIWGCRVVDTTPLPGQSEDVV